MRKTKLLNEHRIGNYVNWFDVCFSILISVFFLFVSTLSLINIPTSCYSSMNSDVNSIFIFIYFSTEYPGRCFEPVTMQLLKPGQDIFLPNGCMKLTCLPNFAFGGSG